jgi:hypothetical protein
MRAWQQALRGEIALADGNAADADAAFRAAEYRIPLSFSIVPVIVALTNNMPFRDGPARAIAARGDLAGASALYRRLVEPDIASPWSDVADPRLVLAGARLAARAADRQAAADGYARFLEMWKGADDGLQELTEARRYLARR